MTYKTRTPRKEKEHDEVVRLIAKIRFGGEEWNVYTNPGTEHNFPVDSRYPDIVVVNINSEEVVVIGEVETSESVAYDEAEDQWKPYSKLGATFYLYVPKGYCPDARKICNELDIKIDGFRHYFYYENALKVENC